MNQSNIIKRLRKHISKLEKRIFELKKNNFNKDDTIKEQNKRIIDLVIELNEYKPTCQQQLSKITELDNLTKDNKLKIYELEEQLKLVNFGKLADYIHKLEQRILDLDKQRHDNAKKLDISLWLKTNNNEQTKKLNEWIQYAHKLEQECQETKPIRATNAYYIQKIEELESKIKLLGGNNDSNQLALMEESYIDLEL